MNWNSRSESSVRVGEVSDLVALSEADERRPVRVGGLAELALGLMELWSPDGGCESTAAARNRLPHAVAEGVGWE